MSVIRSYVNRMAREMTAGDFKKLVLKMANYRCPQHGHSGFTHPNCFLRREDYQEKIGFLDIECHGLDANFGTILTYAILDNDTDEVYGRIITKEEVLSVDADKKITRNVIKAMRKYDRIVVHYGDNGRFDIPYIRTRAVHWGLDFPPYGELKIEDTYTMAKRSLRLNSNRQNVISEILRGESDKTRVIGDRWRRALQGHGPSLKYIYKHNIIDVQELKANYWAMKPYQRATNRSL